MGIKAHIAALAEIGTRLQDVLGERNVLMLKPFQTQLLEECLHGRAVAIGTPRMLGTRPAMVIMDDSIIRPFPATTGDLKRKQLIQRLNVAKAQRNKALIRDLERQLTTL